MEVTQDHYVDVLPLCGPLVAGEGSVKLVAGSQRTGPSTARKGNT